MSGSRKPKWLVSSKLGAKNATKISQLLRDYNINTVCQSAQCPNRGECFDRGTATFMILGTECSRNCAFCAVTKANHTLPAPDPSEPEKIAFLTKKLELSHVVITTVTRDDLPDGGASQFIKVSEEIRKVTDDSVTIEVLVSDFAGDLDQVKKIALSNIDVFNHNIETVPRLYETIRPMADFDRSIDVLKTAKQEKPNLVTKSGLMVGLGETKEEVLEVLKVLRAASVDAITIGQYLQPTRQHIPVVEYIHPDRFDEYADLANQLGFGLVKSAPLVRSSYHAEEAKLLIKGENYGNHNYSQTL